ncbi:MAG TPA: GatB/YqeY domain-containing protein [Dehalococcoidia bacterium]|nr:GatB/YqeY domain-containing protein [Dehalococcoidia bacterium]
MSLQERLREDLKEAIRQGDMPRRSAIRMVMAAITNAEKAQGTTLDDPGVLGIIAKQVKQRRESIEAFDKGGRSDLVGQETAELAVLEAYLPRQMSRDEIVAEARKVIEEVGARGPGDKGKVMPKLIAQLRGRAEGKDINAVVTELLGGR